MTQLFVKNIIYVLVFTFCNIALFSFSSTFHKLLGYDLNTLEEWLYHNRLFLITLAKVMTLFSVLILPNIYYLKLESVKTSFKHWQINLLRIWEIDSKKWLLHFFSVIVVYAFFYNIQINDHTEIYGQEMNQFLLCMIFWSCDLIFLRKIYLDNILIHFKHHRLIISALQALLISATTLIVTYQSWTDQFQFYLILCCIFYLIQEESTRFSGYIILLSVFIIMSFVSPFNFITNIDESKFNLIADNFSLPWSFIFVTYFLIYQYLIPHIDGIYKFLFFKASKTK